MAQQYESLLDKVNGKNNHYFTSVSMVDEYVHLLSSPVTCLGSRKGGKPNWKAKGGVQRGRPNGEAEAEAKGGGRSGRPKREAKGVPRLVTH